MQTNQPSLFRRWRPLIIGIFAFIATTIFILAARTVSEEFDNRLWQYQSLIGGLGALIGGALAYIGIVNQAEAARDHIASTERQHEMVLRNERTLDVREQTARAAALAQQLRHSIRHVIVYIGHLVEILEPGESAQVKRPAIYKEIELQAIDRCLDSFRRFDDTLAWARDVMLQVRPVTQRPLALQIDRSFTDVRNLESFFYFLRRCIANKTWLPEGRIESAQENLKRLEEIAVILKTIEDEGGKTTTTAVTEKVAAQTTARKSKSETPKE